MTASSEMAVTAWEELIEARPEVGEDPIQFWMRKHENEDFSASEIGEWVGYDASVVSRVLQGKYSGNVAAVVKAFDAGRSRMLGTGMGARIRTRNRLAVSEMVSRVQYSTWIGIVHGEPGVGKTTSLLHCLREEGVPMVYLTIHDKSSSRSVLRDLGEQLGVEGYENHDLMRGILGELRKRSRVIVTDEMNNLKDAADRAAGLMNTLRVINDQVSGGLIFAGTTREFYAMLTSRRNAVMMEMVRSRVLMELQAGRPSELEHRALLTAHFGEVAEGVWREYVKGLKDETKGNGLPGSYRRAAAFMTTARYQCLINRVGLTERMVKAAWQATHLTTEPENISTRKGAENHG